MTGTIKPYKSIKSSSETEIKEKGSVFKGIVYPVEFESEVQTILADLRKKNYDASHHCFAYRLKDGNFRHSDDGEPAGTAGKRILNAIDHYELLDIICVIVRWFGGTKLGVGPLGKAYYEAADEAIKSSHIIIKEPFEYYKIKVPYEYTRQLYYVLEKYKVRIGDRNFEDVPEYVCLMPHDKKAEICSELTAFSENKIQITNMDKLDYL